MSGSKGTYANHDNIQTLQQTLSCYITQDTVLLNTNVHSEYRSLLLWHSLLFLNAQAPLCRIHFPKVGFSCYNNSQQWRKQDRTVLPIGPYAARLGQCMPFVVLFALRQTKPKPSIHSSKMCEALCFSIYIHKCGFVGNKVLLTYGEKSCEELWNWKMQTVRTREYQTSLTNSFWSLTAA